jgi:oligosaccharide repeat unit polymerase
MVTAILTIVISLVLSLYITRKILAPATIVSGIWLFCILAYWLYPHGYINLSDQFYIGISLWVGFFTFFSLFRQSTSIRDRHTDEPAKLVRDIYFIITLISFPISVWGIFSIVQAHGLTNHLYASLRNIAIGNIRGVEEGASNNYFATLWLVTYAIELLHFNRKNLGRLIILLLVNFAWAFLVMAKMNFLNLIITSLAILFFKNIIKPKVIYISLAVVFSFFTFLQVIRTVGAENEDDLHYDFFSQYVLSGMPAFEKIKPESSKYFGESSFRFFYKVSEKLGISDKTPENALQPFINVGKKEASYSNVYTTLYPFFKDFGYLGIIIFGALTGFFYGYLYKGLINKNNAFMVSYSILTASIFIQFMSDNTLSTLSFILQIIIFSHLPYWIKNISVKNESNNPIEQNEYR